MHTILQYRIPRALKIPALIVAVILGVQLGELIATALI